MKLLVPQGCMHALNVKICVGFCYLLSMLDCHLLKHKCTYATHTGTIASATVAKSTHKSNNNNGNHNSYNNNHSNSIMAVHADVDASDVENSMFATTTTAAAADTSRLGHTQVHACLTRYTYMYTYMQMWYMYIATSACRTCLVEWVLCAYLWLLFVWSAFVIAHHVDNQVRETCKYAHVVDTHLFVYLLRQTNVSFDIMFFAFRAPVELQQQGVSLHS